MLLKVHDPVFKAMKLRIITSIIGILFGLTFVQRSFAENIPVYIIAGQSNASIRLQAEDPLPETPKFPLNNVKFFSVSRVGGLLAGPRPLGPRIENGSIYYGPELSMGIDLSNVIKKEIALLSVAFGGMGLAKSPLPDFNPANINEGYTTLVRSIERTISILKSQGFTPHIAGLSWIQGETDAKSANAPNDTIALKQPRAANHYEKNLTKLIESLRELFDTKFPVALSVVFIKSPNLFGEFNYVNTVEMAQRRVADIIPAVKLVETSDLSHIDGIHFDSRSVQILGHRLAKSLLRKEDLP
ncbi:MAG: hypothetical protein KDD53_08525 [Bdellovibrionales bacterium]|nr:hypothetical protein [Bdellovibrionales bacterium]